MKVEETNRTLLAAAALVAGMFWTISQAATPPYEDLANVIAAMQATASASGGDATPFTLKDSFGTEIHTEGITLPGTPIWVLTISKSGWNGSRRILVTGTHHAREWVAYRAVLDASQFILNHRSSDTWDDPRFAEFARFKEMNLKALTDNARILAVPIVNAEGYYYSKQVANDPVPDGTAPGWRKNRRDVSAYPEAGDEIVPAPLPLTGVDLNRNYPSSDWGKETYDPPTSTDWQNKSTSRWRWMELFCGKPAAGDWTVPATMPEPLGPAVEKETEGIVTLSTLNLFDCHIDVHSYSGTVGWATDADTSDAAPNLRASGGLSDDKVLRIVGAKAAQLITDPDFGGPYSPQASPYPTSGDTLVSQYQRSDGKCLPFLIEIGKAQQFRPANPTAHADAVLPGQLFMMFAAVDRSFSSKPAAKFHKP